jgi:putative spermidine/putrescine transport system permease protein
MKMRMTLLILPFAVLFGAFFVLPLVKLFLAGAGNAGFANYINIISDWRYFHSLVVTIVFSALVTTLTLAISTTVGLYIERNEFPGRGLLIPMLAFPLAFPGTVIGFLVILVGGRQGVVGIVSQALLDQRIVFAYSTSGLFVAYIYFSIPRTILTIMASAAKLDRSLEEAARSLGCSTFQLVRDVIIPGLRPALIASAAICFATSMGAFGTAFTLASKLDVLPMVIYTEFSLQANLAVAAALSFVLGFITWIVLALARSAAGNTVAAAA